MNETLTALQKNNIDVSQLLEWPTDHCHQVELFIKIVRSY
jgi:hypothetical protein